MIKNFNLYKDFKELNLNGRYITNECIYKLNDIYSFKELGKSTENRPVYYFKVGSGKKKVLIWSQMHGNESTSTRALFDALSYFLKIDKKTLSKLSLHIIPILNPDGASKYKRENANNIDLNRDAIHLTQKESIILKDLYDKINPDFCFNLHDQRSIYSVSDSKKASILSFLSPSTDINKFETDSRLISMKIISSVANRLYKLIPGNFSRYNDDFNENCVGDTFQSLKTPTILFESGHFKNDYSREITRKHMSYALISAFISIAFREYETKNFLNSFFSSKFSNNKNEQMKNLKKFVKNYPNPKNIIFVTHYVVITEALNYAPASGEIVISDKQFNKIDSIEISY